MATRILVPLDGSHLAEQALSCATRLGQGLPAELVLLRAISTPPQAQHALGGAGSRANTEVEDLEARANDYLQGMAHSLRETNPTVHCVVQHGPAAKAIVDCAEKMHMQEIVMATHGYGGLRRWRNGSVADRVLQAASAPVLLVRGCEQNSRDTRAPISCRRILVPLDGSDRAEQVLPPVKAIARALGCEVILFQVSPVFLFECSCQAAERMARAYLTRVASRLEDQGIQCSVAIGTDLVAESIVQFAKTNHVDMIAMSTHGRTGIARWALGSVAARVLRTGNMPILLVRARQKRNKNGTLTRSQLRYA
jgi:nucleotide-binding universal stress UspA family protein